MTEHDLHTLLTNLGLTKIRRIGNNLQACCPNPDHNERRPSWGISLAEPHMHGCFGCGYKGSLRHMLRSIFKWSEAKTDQMLGSEHKAASTDLGSFDYQQHAKRQRAVMQEDELIDWQMRMMEPRGLAYAVSRGLNRRTIIDCGLRYHREDQRLLIPWWADGVLVGVTGRTICNALDKIKAYYRLDKANHCYMPAGRLQKAPVILVEGEFDALLVYQAGHTNVAALGHGRLSEGALSSTLNYYPTEAVLFFDFDETGSRLTKEAIAYFKGRLPVRVVDYHDAIKDRITSKRDPASLSKLQISQCIRKAKMPSPWTNFDLV